MARLRKWILPVNYAPLGYFRQRFYRIGLCTVAPYSSEAPVSAIFALGNPGRRGLYWPFRLVLGESP